MKKNTTALRKIISSLAKRHGTPLFLISESLLIEQVKKFQTLLPSVKPFYAVKANSHPFVLKIFAEYGIGFDVASTQEMKAVLDLGVTPDRIIFANTVKRPEALQFAAQHGVRLMTFDSEYELNKIAKHAPGAHVLIRIKVPNVGSLVELSLKFGAEPVDAIPLLIKAFQMKLKPVGVSFHVGSQNTNEENYLASLEMASMIFNEAKLKQSPLEILDIGGGFPIRHFEQDKDSFAPMSIQIKKELKRLFGPDVQIIAEPGRAFVGPACYLVMQVVGKSIRGNKHWYYLDDGVYGSLSGIIYDHAKYQYRTFRRGVTQITTLAGPTCDSLDIISVSEDMPELEIGDLVYCENIGAYSWATATNFNGIPPAEVVSIP
ncbi:type III PLP-dependent enzyme [Nitrosomonas sp. Nm34]|uniref:type III PLP-dependent enzyme n=1 Tax=Nitrosomonas sp. Nm34 TaxID=1881055 RepID=UPI0008EA8000|nr:type III PLP-dependent enzyme [Nitrosomonas sp. Nm34]SFI42242.1 ornithine decarboxylase [Nitrosomonas sp. Nm34]